MSKLKIHTAPLMIFQMWEDTVSLMYVKKSSCHTRRRFSMFHSNHPADATLMYKQSVAGEHSPDTSTLPCLPAFCSYRIQGSNCSYPSQSNTGHPLVQLSEMWFQRKKHPPPVFCTWILQLASKT